MQNRLIFNVELYKWSHSSISCLLLGNLLVLHRESRLCPCWDDLRTLSISHLQPASKRQKYPCELPERERELCRGRVTFACPRRDVAGKRGPRSGKSILGSAGARPAQASGHGVSWERVQETTGFVQRKNEAAAARRVTFTLEQDDKGTVWAVADTWPAVACPCRGGDGSRSCSCAGDPCSAATVLCCDTASHCHGNPAPASRGGGSSTFLCQGSTDRCQQAQGVSPRDQRETPWTPRHPRDRGYC